MQEGNQGRLPTAAIRKKQFKSKAKAKHDGRGIRNSLRVFEEELARERGKKRKLEEHGRADQAALSAKAREFTAFRQERDRAFAVKEAGERLVDAFPYDKMTFDEDDVVFMEDIVAWMNLFTGGGHGNDGDGV
ncbi:myb-related protein Myb4-like protein [Corchorus capsularis]|uniref:Myb-related protein Myb4-like protein n=1 Tax=Corchorus capsularis TaxID=210143 RepID=A0A1R3GJ13_COCAP|nr:myb-related protein Myb4-like protein [Corchorus capsularis]